MAPEKEDPTAWELLRAVREVRDSVREVADRMLTKDRFDEYQRGTDRRFEALEKRQAEWEAKSERAHGELNAKITSVDDSIQEKDEKARESRGRMWLAIGLVVLGVILPRVWAVLQGTGASP